MRGKWIVAVVFSMPVVSSAQDLTQKLVRTEKVIGTPVGVGLYDVRPDGTVIIDWRAVEAAAECPADKPPTSVAKAMLAIRDGKWRPMPH